jgi:hypothetical protein
MNDAKLIETLLYRGEGDALDFKLQQYKFEGATDDEKSELLKDILAFANSWREVPAYIVIGIREKTKEVEGLDRDIDDSRLQQFIKEKTNKPIRFSYQSLDCNGKKVGLYTIPVQDRPFYIKKDFGKVKANTVYVRRGSSTDQASPDETAKMGAQSIAATAPKLKMTIVSEEEQATSYEQITFDYIHFLVDADHPLPDYDPKDRPPAPKHRDLLIANKDFYREMADYVREQNGRFGFRVHIENLGNTYAEDVRIQLSALSSPGFSLMESGHFLVKPSTNLLDPNYPPDSIVSPFGRQQGLTLGFIKDHLVAEIMMGKLQAGANKISDPIYLVCPPESLDKLCVKILSDHLSAPIEITIPVTVTCKDTWIEKRYIDELEDALPDAYENI